MELEAVFGAAVGSLVILILIYALSDIIFAVQGTLWGILFVISSIVVTISYFISEI
jgi:hypothetical protein